MYIWNKAPLSEYHTLTCKQTHIKKNISDNSGEKGTSANCIEQRLTLVIGEEFNPIIRHVWFSRLPSSFFSCIALIISFYVTSLRFSSTANIPRFICSSATEGLYNIHARLWVRNCVSLYVRSYFYANVLFS